MKTLKIKLLKPAAILPTYAHPGEDAAFDVHSCEDVVLYSGARHIFYVGLASEFPDCYFIKLESRSGLALRFGIVVLGGVIDSGYRGEWGVILYNSGGNPFVVKAGDKIAQATILHKPRFRIEQAEFLSPSHRDTGGFGSTA
jgi:dUTP pyrophosphatase